MRNKTSLFMMLLAAALMLLAGCQEPLDLKVKKGESIRVRVSSRRGVSTKTAYSGQTYTEGNRTFERIDWIPGEDQIRLFSTNTNEVATSGGKAFFDYTIGSVYNNNPADRYSLATLSFPENHEKYGLIWVNEPSATVTVYGIYPPKDEQGEESEAVTNSGKLSGFVGLNIPSPGPASGEGAMLTWTTSGNVLVGAPTADYMKHAYMVSKPTKFSTTSDDPQWNGKPYVDLDFYPIFNAFYFELKGADASEIALNSISLSNTADDSGLTGDYRFNYKGRTGDYPFDVNGPTYQSITQTGNLSHTVTVPFPANTKISSTKSVQFTILTLPPTKMTDGKTNLTNLVLTVNYGNNQTKSLRLNDHVPTTNVTDDNKYGTPIAFPAFHKARITGLAMEGGAEWKLQVDALPWTLYEKETTFSQNIQSTAFTILNAKETGNNYYPDATTRTYQNRTLDVNNNKTFFEVTFTPQAPLGGYWQLIPQTPPDDPNAGLGVAAFSVVVWDEDNQVGSSDLKGHIMNQRVTLRIISNVTDDQRDVDHAIIIKAIFSTSASFDENSTFSADSEIQDVHRDGSFSYWRFVIPAKTN